MTEVKEHNTFYSEEGVNEKNTKEVDTLWKHAVYNAKKKDYFDLEKECYLCTKHEVPLIRFHAFDDYEEVNAFFSTRFGGESTGYLSSLNLGFERGDSLETVERNYQRICKSAGIHAGNLVLSDQVHDTKIRYVTKEDSCMEQIKKKLKSIDGLVTDQREICLATSYADCVPLYFVDPIKKVIGLSHSGWRGTVGKIGKETVRVMKEHFGCDPADILAAVGPSICQDCYEVSGDVIEKFKEAFDEKDWDNLFYRKNNGKYQLDLWKANESVFRESGICKEHIAVTNVCTHCNSKILYSHRETGDKRGNLCAFLALK